MSLNQRYSGLFRFAPSEFIAVAVVAGIFAFSLTFQMWGDANDNFNAAIGLTNLLVVFIGLCIVVLGHEAGHKIAGLYEGYEVKIRMFRPGVILSGFITLYAQGFLPFITPNLVSVDARPDLRIGKYRRYDNPSEAAKIAWGGIMGSVIMIFVFATLWKLTLHPLMWKIALGAVLHAIFSLIPFEIIGFFQIKYMQTPAKSYAPGDGLHLLWWSKYAYIFTLAFVIVFGGLMLASSPVALVLALILAVIVTYAYSKWLTY